MSAPTSADREPDVTVLAEEILRYLGSHASASDTAEGIARWWLSRQRLDESLVLVEATLDRLVGAALLERRECGVGPARYRLPAGGRTGRVADAGQGDAGP